MCKFCEGKETIKSFIKGVDSYWRFDKNKLECNSVIDEVDMACGYLKASFCPVCGADKRKKKKKK